MHSASVPQFDVDTSLRILLTGLTSGDGLGFNRAAVYLYDEIRRRFVGSRAIGPASAEEAHRIWEAIEIEGRTLDQIIASASRQEGQGGLQSRVYGVEVTAGEAALGDEVALALATPGPHRFDGPPRSPGLARLGADKTNRGASYPDYHRLYKGGVKENKLVVSLVYGLIDHDHGGPADDYNFGELMTTLDKVMAARGEFKVIDAPVDLGRFELPSGRVLEGVSFADAVRWKTSWSTPPGMSSADKTAAIKLFAEKIYRKWITVERTVNVKIGDEAPKDVGVQLMFYYGADRDSAPHKFATKNSDVILYNGHSYIGSGPLDPTRFTRDDFSKAYQILWVDGCVSYNYYHKDYIPLKEGGTKNLDLITNGLEAPSYRSGLAMGQFLARFLDGQGASYKDLLEAADDTDALRVVDGELDNEWRPERFPLVVR